jgi:hypothetical protein
VLYKANISKMPTPGCKCGKTVVVASRGCAALCRLSSLPFCTVCLYLSSDDVDGELGDLRRAAQLAGFVHARHEVVDVDVDFLLA